MENTTKNSQTSNRQQKGNPMRSELLHPFRSGLLQDMIREIRWIYCYTARYHRRVILYLLLSIALTVTGLAASVSSKYIIDAVTGRNAALLWQLAAVYLVFSLLRILLNAVSSRFSSHLSIQAGNEIRADIFDRFLNIDWQASLSYHSGDLLSRINGDVNTVANSVLGLIPSLTVSLIQFAAALLVILFYDPVMAAIALVSAPLTALLSRFFLVKLRRFSQKVREAQASMIAFYEEALQNLQAVKAFGLNRSFHDRLAALQTLYRDIALEHNRFSVASNLLLTLVTFSVSLLCMAWGIYCLWNGRISFGTLALFLQLASMVSGAFSSLVSLVPSAISATVAAGRLMAIVELPMENSVPTPQAQAVLSNAPSHGVSILAEQVRFSYRSGHTVFEDLNLHADPGEIIGIVSPSGGGKTTLIRMLLGLIAPDGGSITYSSGNTTATFTPCLRQLVAYVAQEKVVFSGTVADSLRLSNPQASDDEMEQALRLACAWDFVSSLPQGLQTTLGERGSSLSEGQIQRLAIARALLSSAPVLLLDEATSALDMATEHRVLKNILSDTARRTVLVTTHRPTVLRACSRVYTIENCHTRQLSQSEIQQFFSGQPE